ncbi:conserved hypothetical protein [Burkholderia cenocepacia PC184]|nr:conserved hypothetical protein [Burkholderia cenocepacia PC184]
MRDRTPSCSNARCDIARTGYVRSPVSLTTAPRPGGRLSHHSAERERDKMKCMICDADGDYYFSKTYTERPFSDFMSSIGKVDYYKCRQCGFVWSGTHQSLPAEKWSELNRQFHHYIENPANETKGNQPPYAEQAMMLALLGKNGVIRLDNMVDYAAGYGTLSNVLAKYYDLELPIFDLYVKNDGSGRYIDPSNLGRYKTVINSAMFEHVLRRSDLDFVHDMVDHDGALVIHTVVCERVPNDPEWFYLRPPRAYRLSYQSKHDHPDGAMGLSGITLLSSGQVLGSASRRVRTYRRNGCIHQSRTPDHVVPLQGRIRRLLEGILDRPACDEMHGYLVLDVS